jgi:hypothetical protein
VPPVVAVAKTSSTGLAANTDLEGEIIKKVVIIANAISLKPILFPITYPPFYNQI